MLEALTDGPDLQHAISLRLFGGLSLAPISNPEHVLDIGTGTGIWAIEFGRCMPQPEGSSLTCDSR